MKIKLFCIPYAGGTASMYNYWIEYFNSHIHCQPIELAGKGRRLNEPLYDNLYEAVEDVFSMIKDELDDSPYMFFGHSMGTEIIYHLAHKIRQENLNYPQHIFLSGSGAPHFKRKDEKVFHLMENEVFKQEIIDLGGTPPAFFNHPELVDIFLPALKNDFKILETTSYKDEIKPFECDISILIGKEDDLTDEEKEGWKNYTTQTYAYHYFEGGHFFYLDKMTEVTRIINQVVTQNIILK